MPRLLGYIVVLTPHRALGRWGVRGTPALCWASGQPGQATEGHPPNCKAGSISQGPTHPGRQDIANAPHPVSSRFSRMMEVLTSHNGT